MMAKVYEETQFRTCWSHMLNKYEDFAEVGRKNGQSNLILEGENTQFHLTEQRKFSKMFLNKCVFICVWKYQEKCCEIRVHISC